YYGHTFYGAMARSRLAELKRQQVAVASPPGANPSAGSAAKPPADENDRQMRTRYAALVSQGDTSVNNRDYDRAIADYSEAITLVPTNAPAFFGRGSAYVNKGDNDRAIADYNEAIRLDPKFAFAFNNRGFAYFRKGDPDRAIADFSEAIRLDPKYVLA